MDNRINSPEMLRQMTTPLTTRPESTSTNNINPSISTDGTATVDPNAPIIEQFNMVLLQRSEVLSGDIRSFIQGIERKNNQLAQIANIVGKARDYQMTAPTLEEMEQLQTEQNQPSWSVNQDNSPQQINLDNGYTIEIHGRTEAWTIRDANGHETTIWGDPHVTEGDDVGSRDSFEAAMSGMRREIAGEATDHISWDFHENATFVLGDGTEIHVGTAPHATFDGTVTDTLTIVNGNQSIRVTGIADNNPVIGEPTREETVINPDNDYVFYMGEEADDWLFDPEGENIEIGLEQRTTITNLEGVGATATIEENEGSGSQGIYLRLSSEDLALFEELNIQVFDASGVGNLTRDEVENLISSLQSVKDSLTSTTQVDMVKLQSLNGKFEQNNSMNSNLIKTFFGIINQIIGNLRG